MPCEFFPETMRGCGKPDGCGDRRRCAWVKHDARAASAEKRKAVRTCPLPTFPAAGRPENWCRWCGGEIVHGRVKQRGWHDGREGEPDCKFEWQLHTDPRVQYPFLVNRDGERCADCGEAPGRWIRGSEVIVYLSPAERATWPPGERSPMYREVRWTVALEIEHVVPLWSVAHLPPDERRPFFGPENLKLRCPVCHGLKTTAEAGSRAKGNRQAKMRLDVPRETSMPKGRRFSKGAGKLPAKGSGRKLPSRPFPKKSRPLRR